MLLSSVAPADASSNRQVGPREEWPSPWQIFICPLNPDAKDFGDPLRVETTARGYSTLAATHHHEAE